VNETKVKTPELWERHRNQWEKTLEEFRGLRFCYSYGDLRPDIYAVAVPLRRGASSEIVVMNCVLQSYQISQGQLEQEVGPRLVALGDSLDGHLA
jgi:DNA-binding IclR family transcriptional regulator